MQFRIRMSITVTVNNETAVLIAGGARAMGENWGDSTDGTEAIVMAMSSVADALGELMMPEHAASHIPGIDVDSTVVSFPKLVV